QFFRGGQESFVLRRLPNHDVVMRDNWDTALDQNLIAASVIEMVMTIDGVLDGPLSQRLNFADKFFHRDRREERVEDQHTIIADDESCIPGGESSRLRDSRIDTFGYFYQLKVVVGFWCYGRGLAIETGNSTRK